MIPRMVQAEGVGEKPKATDQMTRVGRVNSIGFVMRYTGQSTLLEVKAATGNTKSTKTALNHPEKYHVGGAIKPGSCNVDRAGQILALPFCMAFLLTAF